MADFKDRVLANIAGAIEGTFACWWDGITAANRHESPLETGFLFAFSACMHIDAEFRVRVSDDIESAKARALKDRVVALVPQAPILEYRVDFLIVFAGRNELVEEIVIECDGHDYHERTKEQASRDKARDRAMQAAGYKVFRFTGSDLYADAWGCANEIRKYVTAQSEGA